jgi:hypothetical protein
VEGILPRDPADHEGESVVWLIGGEADDVDEFIDAVGAEDPVPQSAEGDVIDMSTWPR